MGVSTASSKGFIARVIPPHQVGGTNITDYQSRTTGNSYRIVGCRYDSHTAVYKRARGQHGYWRINELDEPMTKAQALAFIERDDTQ